MIHRKTLALLVVFFMGLPSYAGDDPDLDYFKQFLFQKQERDDGDDHLVVTYLYPWAMNWVSLPGESLRFSEARLILRENGEATVLANAGRWEPGYPPSFCLDRYDAKWSVVDKELRIGTAIVGSRVFEAGQHAIKLRFLEKIGMFPLKGEEITVMKQKHSEDPIVKFETTIFPICSGWTNPWAD